MASLVRRDDWGIGPTAASLEEPDAGGTTLSVSCVLRADAEDFMVTEIDAAGAALPLTPEEARDRNYHHPAVVSATRRLDRPAVRIAVLPLDQLGLPPDVVAALQRLADDAPSAMQRVDIGDFTDKELRGSVRCSIKYALPQLKMDLDGGEPSSSSGQPDGHRPMDGPATSGSSLSSPSRLYAVRDPDFAIQCAVVGFDRAAAIARYCIDSMINPNTTVPLRLSLSDLILRHGDVTAKEERRRLHASVVSQYPFLNSVYADSTLTISRAEPRCGSSRKRNADGSVAASCYTHFVLHKRCVDALDAKRRVARALKVSLDSVAVAGTKDKRAVTWQRISVPGDLTFRLHSDGALVVYESADGGAFVKLFAAEVLDGPVRMGEHRGNLFSIVARSMKPCTATMDTNALLCRRLEHIRRVGFVNYFGPQRFGELGTRAASLPGIHVLQGNYAAAVECVLAPLPGECEAAAAAKAIWRDTRDPVATLRKVPRPCRDLTEVMLQLRRCGVTGGDGLLDEGVAERALEGMPFDLRQLWLHAAQSFIFNTLASRRLEVNRAKGNVDLTPIAGDWIRIGDRTDDSPRSFERVGYAGGPSLNEVRDRCASSEFSLVLPIIGEGTALVVDAAARHAGAATVDDDVIDVLRELGLSPLSFAAAPLGVKLKGGLRPVIQLPLSVDSTSLRIDDGNNALHLHFGLPTSSYATVVMRELLGEFPQSQ